MNEDLRQTGRTTRMIAEAIRLAKCGFAVYIFMSNGAEAQKLLKKVDATWMKHESPALGHGIKVEAFTDAVAQQFDWQGFGLRGSHQNVKVLIDHFVIEKRILKLQTRMAELAEEVRYLYPMTI